MKNSKIEWCDHTWNPWIGCTKVSPGCANCYAERLDRRWGHDSWGAGKARRRTSEEYWRQPLRWNEAEQHVVGSHEEFVAYRRPRVFCASLADWLDDEVPIDWLADLLDLIRRTPNLDWLLLTKRPENWSTRIAAVMQYLDALARTSGAIRHATAQWCGEWLEAQAPGRWHGQIIHYIPANIWIGTTVEDQQRADERIPHLLRIPARVRFLSCEPLLGPVDLSFGNPKWRTAESYHAEIHWVICGGESGPNARPMYSEWARSLRDQCKVAGVPFMFKQWGEYLPYGQCSPHVGDPDGRKSEYHEAKNGTDLVSWLYRKLGKSVSGRLLDGVEHNEFP